MSERRDARRAAVGCMTPQPTDPRAQSTRRAKRATSVDPEPVPADRELIAWAKLAPPDRRLVDPRAVRRIEVLEDPASVSKHEQRVATRDAGSGQADVTTRVTTDEQPIAATAPVQGEQHRWALRIGSRVAAQVLNGSTDRSASSAEPPVPRSAPTEVPDDAGGVNQTGREQPVEAVDEGVLAEQPSAVRCVQRLSELVACGSRSDHRSSFPHRHGAVQPLAARDSSVRLTQIDWCPLRSFITKTHSGLTAVEQSPRR